MPFMQALLFFIKYGAGIFNLVKGIWELADWIKARDSKVQVTGKMMRQNLHVLARQAKPKKRGEQPDLKQLQKMRDTLANRKAEIERGEQ